MTKILSKQKRKSMAAALVGVSLFLTASAAAAPNDVDAMNAWATSVVELIRGPMDVAQPELGLANYGTEAEVLGPIDPLTNLAVLSLGDGGSITLGFDDKIHDGPGADFAVFENGFYSEFGLFAEFAFVEVSSDGVVFAGFDPVTTRVLPVLPFEEVDPADYAGFAGDEESGYGTLFDLSDLIGDPLVASGDIDLMDINYVRVTDVIGNGSTVDSLGSPVYDPYPTPLGESGFDLDGVGVINVPEPALALSLLFGWLTLLGLERRYRRALSVVAMGLAIGLAAGGAAANQTVDFESLDLTPTGVYNGSDSAGGFTVGGVTFVNDYNTTWGSWDGFAASSISDGTTPGWSNQYAAKPGAGAEASDQYAIGYQNYFDNRAPTLQLAGPETVLSVDIANTTYAYYSMLNGDGFSEKFGGTDGTVEDWFTITIHGLDALGQHNGNTVDYDLADYRGIQTFILDSWTTLDLTSLGVVYGLEFQLTSSTGVGTTITNPTYFAMDNLVYTPEPGTGLLLCLGLLALAAGATPSRSR